MDMVGTVLIWAAVIWLAICLVTTPFVWLLAFVSVRQRAHEQRGGGVAAARERHPAYGRTRGPRGPEDDPRWSAWNEQEDEQ
jgi:hypothetical protein